MNENDELSETMIISDQFLATCTGLQQALASRHWPHVVYSALPTPHLPPALKSLLSWYCSGSRSSEQSGILPVPQGRVSAKLLQRLPGAYSFFYLQSSWSGNQVKFKARVKAEQLPVFV